MADDYYLYLIGVEDEDHVKFGLSKHPEKRLKQLQTGSPKKLVLLASYAYDKKRVRLIEQKVHQSFACYRMSGEWFELDHTSAAQLFTWANVRYEDESETILRLL